MVPLIGGALIGAGGSLLGGALGAIGQNHANKTNQRLQRDQNEWNAKQASQANKWNMEQWQRENEYNSPTQQMQRLESAGLNPNLMYSQGNVGTASKLTSNVPTSVAPARTESSLSQFANSIVPAISMYQDMQNKQAQLSVQEKQAKLLDQEIANKALDNVFKGYRNTRESEVLPFYQMNAMADAQRKRLTSENMAVQGRIQTLNENILLKTMPDVINKASWVTRDVKQRALRGEIDNDLNRQLKPFGMTSSDQLWQRKLVPILETYIMKALTGGKKMSLYDFIK